MSWEVKDGKLTRSFTFNAFLDGIAFVQQVAQVAEELDHHPDIDVRWTTVTLAVNTHDQGGAITDKDHGLAARVDALLA